MLIPSRTKYRRVHRLPHEGRSRGNRELAFGDYGLQAKKELGSQQIKSKLLVSQ